MRTEQQYEDDSAIRIERDRAAQRLAARREDLADDAEAGPPTEPDLSDLAPGEVTEMYGS